MFNYISKQNPYHEMKKMGINGFQKFVVCDINKTTAFKIVQDLLQLELVEVIDLKVITI